MAQILIADDDKSMREMIGMVCRSLGHEVRESIDTLSTLSAYSAEAPDLMILDLYMPGGGGIEVLRQLGLATDGLLCKVLVVSGYVADLDSGARRILANTRILEKPFTIETLKSAIVTSLLPG